MVVDCSKPAAIQILKLPKEEGGPCRPHTHTHTHPVATLRPTKRLVLREEMAYLKVYIYHTLGSACLSSECGS